MTDTAGPWELIEIDGRKVPLYVIQFNEKGDCIADKTRKAFLADLTSGGYTDLLFFSHGWNNDWTDATDRYRDFIKQFYVLAAKHAGKLPNPYKPLFAGIFWPSISLLLPWEEPPAPAAAATGVDLELRAIADLLPDEEGERFLALANRKDPLTLDDARKLAVMFAKILKPVDDVTQAQESVTADDILASWRAAPSPARVDAGDGLEEPDVGIAGSGTDHARAAGLLNYLDPRWIVRLGTVRIMKDRAGLVGAIGVAKLLNDVIAANGPRVHAIGHSYGAKVLLTAASGLTTGKLASLLLLQPAVSYLCFSKDVGGGVAGGFSGLATKVARPVFATFSSHDFPLCNVYHYALRRASDLGEVRPAAVVPSRYAALGGYGPPEAAGDMEIYTLPAAGAAFPAVAASVRIAGFDGSNAISGHGDVLKDPVYWALLQQMA